MPRAASAESSTKSKRGRGVAPPHKQTLNFKVTPEFKKRFKGYAVSQGLTMLELLNEGFELSKQQRQRGDTR